MKRPLLAVTAGLLVASVCAPVLRAQKALYAEHKGKFHLVRAVTIRTPKIDDGHGKLIEATGRKYVLEKAPEYLPVFISIRDLRIRTRALELVDTGQQINNNFDFRAKFESPYALDNVYAVLELESQNMGKMIYAQEIGRLEPRRPKELDLTLPLNDGLGEGRYKLHVFADGAEVFTSQLPFGVVESKLDAMVRERIKGVQDAMPKPFVGPAPDYPRKLLRAKVSGSAVIGFTLSPTGRVLDPQVKSASDPAFGESALEAARQWRFLPRVKGGKAVAAPVTMPFNFSPPDATRPADSKT